MRLIFKEKNGFIYQHGPKSRFWSSLSQQFSFKRKNINPARLYKDFEFEGDEIRLSVIHSIYFELSEEEAREYKIANILK